jgi:hypothetical protein
MLYRWRPDAARTKSRTAHHSHPRERPHHEVGGVHDKHGACSGPGLGETWFKLRLLESGLPGRMFFYQLRAVAGSVRHPGYGVANRAAATSGGM